MRNLGKYHTCFTGHKLISIFENIPLCIFLILIVILWDRFWKNSVVLWALACFFWTQFFHTKTSESAWIHACRVTARKCSEPARWIKSQLEGAPPETQCLYLCFEIRNWSWYGGRSMTEIAKTEREKKTYFWKCKKYLRITDHPAIWGIWEDPGRLAALWE